jgi:hypothetical protein
VATQHLTYSLRRVEIEAAEELIQLGRLEAGFYKRMLVVLVARVEQQAQMHYL